MADQKKVQLVLSVKAEGADNAAAGIKKLNVTAMSLQQELAKIGRTDQLQKLGTEMGALARKTGNVDKAVDELTKSLKELGATKDEIAGAASAFNQAQTGGGLGPGGNLLQRLGAQGRNLPSVQIPGAGIGTDAISNLTRLTGALGEAAGASKAMSAATAFLTPIMGATAASIGGVIAVAGPVALAFVAIGAAATAFGNQVAAEAKAINTIVESQRSLSERIAEGLTSEQVTQELDVLNKKRKEEADLLFKTQQVYDETINSNKSVAHIVKLTSGAEEELNTQILKGTELVKTYDADIANLTKAQQDGSFAANDAAEAEKKLADERTKAVLSSADAAAKSLQAEQKALASTEEQNNARLAAIENEEDVVQKQIDVLTASGDTSEAVTEKIAALTSQLGLLGDETSFIKNTALEASRAADAEKKAKKDAEDAAKKAQQAQEQYTKAVTAAGTTFKQSVQDIGTRLTQALSDNTLKFNRDLTNIATKYRRDEFDLTLKAQRAERDALLDQQDDLKDIRKSADKDEAAALEQGDFKLLYQARLKRDETLELEQEGLDLSRQKREQSFKDAQDDLLRNAQRQRQDRMLGYEQQSTDIRTNQQRELAQARLTQQRALQAASEAQNAGLGQITNYWNKFLSIQQQGMNNSLKVAAGQGAGPNGSRATGPGAFAPGSFSASALGSVIRR